MHMNLLGIPVLGLAGGLFVLGRRLYPRCGWGQRGAWFALGLLLALPGLLIAGYYLHLFGEWRWFYEFRAVPGSELTAIGVGFPAGILYGLLSERVKPLRFLAVLGCALAVAVPYLKPLYAPLPSSHFRDQWSDGVCLQSTEASCGPASTATLLRHFGRRASEREIAAECHTYLGGTENWYLARALRRRGFTVRYLVTRPNPAHLPSPAIAGVNVNGLGHFITILGETPDAYIIGEPLAGRLQVAKSDLSQRYDFTGFFMVVGRK